MRLHGPTKATTLGVGSLLIASAVFFSSRNAGISMHEVLITLFLFITAPVSAHLLAKAALHLDLHSRAKIPVSPVHPIAIANKGTEAGTHPVSVEENGLSDIDSPHKPV